MRQIPKRESIEDVGLEKFLDSTRDQHNGLGYAEFVQMLNSELNYSKTQIATAFGVHRDTIYNWLAIYEKEQGNGTGQQEA